MGWGVRCHAMGGEKEKREQIKYKQRVRATEREMRTSYRDRKSGGRGGGVKGAKGAKMFLIST